MNLRRFYHSAAQETTLSLNVTSNYMINCTVSSKCGHELFHKQFYMIKLFSYCFRNMSANVREIPFIINRRNIY